MVEWIKYDNMDSIESIYGVMYCKLSFGNIRLAKRYRSLLIEPCSRVGEGSCIPCMGENKR